MGGLANLLGGGEVGFAGVVEMANDVFDDDNGAIDDHAEVERAEGEEVCWDVSEVEADGGKEQSERHGEGDNDGAARVAKEEKEDDDDEEDAFGEVVQDGVGGVVEEVAAIEEGNDFDAGGKD